MTTMAALLGALPLALGSGTGSELRRPLGITIIGGLIMSQLLTLYTTPVVYLYFDTLSHWWDRVRGRKGVGIRAVAVTCLKCKEGEYRLALSTFVVSNRSIALLRAAGCDGLRGLHLGNPNANLDAAIHLAVRRGFYRPPPGESIAEPNIRNPLRTGISNWLAI